MSEWRSAQRHKGGGAAGPGGQPRSRAPLTHEPARYKPAIPKPQHLNSEHALARPTRPSLPPRRSTAPCCSTATPARCASSRASTRKAMPSATTSSSIRPADLVGGDVLEVNVHAAVPMPTDLLATPGATRFYRSEGPVAPNNASDAHTGRKRAARMAAAGGHRLPWLPGRQPPHGHPGRGRRDDRLGCVRPRPAQRQPAL